MSAVNFDPNVSVQADGAVTGLRIFFSGIPILGTLIAMWIMRNYDLTEDKAKEIKEELIARKQLQSHNN
jgi:GPH family glycoside/pentoside/hexuronide:cation symporter